MEFIKMLGALAGAISTIIALLVTIQKITKGKLVNWIVKPIVDPLRRRMDEFEINNNMCKNKITDELRELKIDNLKQIIMNDNIPISERLEAGDRYINMGGNGAIKVYYKKLRDQYYNNIEVEERK